MAVKTCKSLEMFLKPLWPAFYKFSCFACTVTRLGEFSPIRWLFWGAIFKNSEAAQKLLFLLGKSYASILSTNELATRWVIFSYPHLVTLRACQLRSEVVKPTCMNIALSMLDCVAENYFFRHWVGKMATKKKSQKRNFFQVKSFNCFFRLGMGLHM
jgi:hypothetical protein